MSHTPNWLIWSNANSAWWRPDRSGYTMYVASAGRYTFDEALRLCKRRTWDEKDETPPPELPVPAPEFYDSLRNHDRLTAEVGRLRDVLHSIHLRAELAEADGVHMRGALGNIKDDAAKALNPEEPK